MSGPDDALVRSLAAAAAAAPSMHNVQPWRFRFLRGSATFEVRVDPERALPHTDPTGRAAHLGCGAAVCNLRVAAAHAGLTPSTTLLPTPADPGLLATVRLTEANGPEDPAARAAGADLAALQPAVARRHTSRLPFTDAEVPVAVRDALGEAASREGARLVFTGPWHAQLLLDLAVDAESLDAHDADTATEGVPESAYGPRRRGGKAPVRDFAGRHRPAGRGAADFERSPCLALLGTARDRPRAPAPAERGRLTQAPRLCRSSPARPPRDRVAPCTSVAAACGQRGPSAALRHVAAADGRGSRQIGRGP